MKKAFFVVNLAVLLIISVASCNKPVYKYNADFEGTWRTLAVYDTILDKIVQSEIVIDGKDGSFKNTCESCNTNQLCNCVSFQVGKAVMNDTKTQMRIGSNGFPLTIDQEPKVNSSGVWTMIIKGQTYYRN
ncbi:MAG: hypothetical protein RI922_1045 [Bacteroidota bacterium]|jgi:hypothetical protein